MATLAKPDHSIFIDTLCLKKYSRGIEEEVRPLFSKWECTPVFYSIHTHIQTQTNTYMSMHMHTRSQTITKHQFSHCLCCKYRAEELVWYKVHFLFVPKPFAIYITLENLLCFVPVFSNPSPTLELIFKPQEDLNLQGSWNKNVWKFNRQPSEHPMS